MATAPKVLTDAQISTLATEALDAACRHIQDALGVTTGDLAALVMSDGEIEEKLEVYIRSELDAIAQDPTYCESSAPAPDA